MQRFSSQKLPVMKSPPPKASLPKQNTLRMDRKSSVINLQKIQKQISSLQNSKELKYYSEFQQQVQPMSGPLPAEHQWPPQAQRLPSLGKFRDDNMNAHPSTPVNSPPLLACVNQYAVNQTVNKDNQILLYLQLCKKNFDKDKEKKENKETKERHRSELSRMSSHQQPERRSHQVISTNKPPNNIRIYQQSDLKQQFHDQQEIFKEYLNQNQFFQIKQNQLHDKPEPVHNHRYSRRKDDKPPLDNHSCLELLQKQFQKEYNTYNLLKQEQKQQKLQALSNKYHSSMTPQKDKKQQEGFRHNRILNFVYEKKLSEQKTDAHKDKNFQLQISQLDYSKDMDRSQERKAQPQQATSCQCGTDDKTGRTKEEGDGEGSVASQKKDCLSIFNLNQHEQDQIFAHRGQKSHSVKPRPKEGVCCEKKREKEKYQMLKKFQQQLQSQSQKEEQQKLQKILDAQKAKEKAQENKKEGQKEKEKDKEQEKEQDTEKDKEKDKEKEKEGEKEIEKDSGSGEQSKESTLQPKPVAKPKPKKKYKQIMMSDVQIQLLIKQKRYIDFINMIRVSQGKPLYLSYQKPMQTYKVYVGKGNNQALIKSTFRSKYWWHINEDKSSSEVNFYWQQLRNDEVIARIRETNKTLNRSAVAITREQVLRDFYIPMGAECSMTDYYPYLPQFFNQEQVKHIRKNEATLQNKDLLMLWLYRQIGKEEDDVAYPDLPKILIHNHLQANFHLSNKKALFYNMVNYCELVNIDPFSIIPLTYHITCKKNLDDDLQYLAFAKKYAQLSSDPISKNIWIVKPGENTNRGVGIRVSDSLDEIRAMVDKTEGNKTFIIQKYLEKGLLYKGRKMDMRCYMLVNSSKGYLKAYWYQEGYVRTSSQAFSLANLSNKQVHLTNDAIQVRSDDYGKFENANKVSFADIGKYLEGKHKGLSWEDITNQMMAIAKQSVESVVKSIDPERLEHTFEIFGFDFMIDDAFKVQLIEINTNPDLEISCSLLQRLIPSMLDNSLKIVVDSVFTPPDVILSKKQKLYSVDSIFPSNKYTLIFDEALEKPRLEALFQNSIKRDMAEFDEQEEEFE